MGKFAIIVAGGEGTRMQSEIPKQFLEVRGKPVLVHSIEKFLQYDPDISLILILPKDQYERWSVLKNSFLPDKIIEVAAGGETRTASVRAGLSIITNNGFVAIHDAVRPFVSESTIRASFESATKRGSGIAAIPLKDSIRELKDSGSITRDRSSYMLVQTPQTFQVKLLQDAYRSISSDSFADDATVFEHAGYDVHLVEGSYSNIKITTPEDLRITNSLV